MASVSLHTLRYVQMVAWNGQGGAKQEEDTKEGVPGRGGVNTESCLNVHRDLQEVCKERLKPGLQLSSNVSFCSTNCSTTWLCAI